MLINNDQKIKNKKYKICKERLVKGVNYYYNNCKIMELSLGG